jgi:FxsC-like protein
MAFEDFLYFVSYARDDYYIAGGAGLEENVYLRQFFADLREAVRIRSGRAQTDPIEYRDIRQIDLGKAWRPDLLDGLQRSRCLLALYTPTFFNRVECGKEVRFLQCRVGNRYAAGTEPHSFILPVIWQDPVHYPASLQALNYFYGALPAEYKEYGLRVLAQSGKFADKYRQSVEAIADRIDAVRRMEPLPKLAAPPDVATLESAFAFDALGAPAAATGPGAKGPNAVRFAYIAALASEVAGKAQRDHYGDTSEEWRPSPADERGLGLVAPEVAARSRFYQRAVELSHNADEEIAKLEQDRALLVLLVDVWSGCRIPKYRDLVRKYDAKSSFHVAVIVVWADADADVDAFQQPLTQQLRYVAFPFGHQRGAPFFRPAVRGLAEFEVSLRETLERLRMEVMTRAEAVRALDAVDFSVRPVVSSAATSSPATR